MRLETWVMTVQLELFSHEPSDGLNDIYGEYLINAQGDVVAGTRTPQYITIKAKKEAKAKEMSMEESCRKFI